MIVKSNSRRLTIKKNKKTKQLKNKKSKQLKNKKSIKRLKKKYTRQIYYAGADSPSSFEWPEIPVIKYLFLKNVNNDDPRLLNFMENPSTFVYLQNSPNLTRIPYLNILDKVNISILNCSSLVSIDHRNLRKITFGDMNISNDMLKQELHVDALLVDYCCDFSFENCTFDEDCEIIFISTDRHKYVSFSRRTGLPRYPFDSIQRLNIQDCQNVSFPYFNQNNVLTSLTIKNNQYINNEGILDGIFGILI